MAVYNLGTARGSIEIDTKDLRQADLVLQQSGRAMIGVGTALVGAFAAVVGTAANFESEMDFVRAVTNATADELDALKNTAIELGKKGPFGPIELSKTFVELAKAGATAEQITNGVAEATVNLATAAQTDLPSTGEALIGILNTWALGADHATEAADLLAGSANASAINLDDLVTSFRYAGPVANNLGISMEDLAAAVTMLGKVNIRGSTAGTSLRRILIQLSPTTARSADALKKLGIITEDGTNKFFDAQGQAKGLADVFQILQDATKDLTDQQKIQAINDIFGARAIPSALLLMNQGAEGFAAINEEIGRTTAADVAAERMDNLNGAMMRLKAAIEATFITAGTPFQKMLQGIVEGARKMVLWFGKLDPRLQSFLVGSMAVVGILSIMSGVFLLTIGTMVRALRLFGDLIQVVKLLGGIMRIFNLTLLANPYVLVIVAILALIAVFYLLYTRVEGFRDFINAIPGQIMAAWDGIVKGFQDIGQGIADVFTGVVDAVTGFFEDIGDVPSAFADAFSGGAVTEGMDSIVGLAQRAGAAMGDFYNDVRDWLGRAVGVVSRIPGQIGRFLAILPGIMGRAAARAVEAFITFHRELPKRVGYALGFVIGRTILWGRQLAGVIESALTTALRTVITWGRTLFTTWVGIGVEVLAAIAEWLTTLPGLFLTWLTAAREAVLRFGLDIVQLAREAGPAFFHAIVDLIAQIPGAIWGFLQSAWNFIWEFVPQFLAGATALGQGLFDGIINVITGLPGQVWQILQNVIDAFLDLVQNAYDAAKDFASGLWEGFKDGIGLHSPSFLEKAMTQITTNVNKSVEELRRSLRQTTALAVAGVQVAAGLANPQLPKTLEPGVVKKASSGGGGGSSGGGGGGNTYIYNTPLIGEAHIRSDYDIAALAKELEDERELRERARGRQVA